MIDKKKLAKLFKIYLIYENGLKKMKYKNFVKFHQKTILQSKIQKFNNILKKENVHNRLYNDSIKKEKVLNDLQLKYLAAEAKQYTFIPRVNHNCNLNIKKDKSNKRSYKTPLIRKNTQRLETPGKMREVFSIKSNFVSKWNKSEKKNVNYLNEHSNNKDDIGTYYIKDKSRGIYKKVNNNKLKSQLLNQRNPIKSFHKSKLLKTYKIDGFSKLTTKNLEFNNSAGNNNNNKINIRINTNINNQLLNELNTYRLKNHKYFTTINNLFKDDTIVNNNFLYNTNNHYNNKTIQENKPHYKEYSNIQNSITDAKTKNSVINNNIKNKIINSKNRLNNHSISTGVANINFQNNMLSSIKKEKRKESNISYKTLELSKNISDCFSLLFNNYLKKGQKKIQYEKKQLENRKISKNIKNKKKKISKVKTSINSISGQYNLYSDKLPFNDNTYFHSIDYGNNLINNNNFNNTDNYCYFIREKNKFLYTNSKEILFDLSNLNNNVNKNNNSEIKANCNYYTIDLMPDKDNSGSSKMDLNYKSKIKNKKKNFLDKINKNNNLILNTNNKVTKDLLPELNKSDLINNKLKFEYFNFNSLGEKHEKTETINKNLEKKNNIQKKIKKLSLINIENNYIQNENNIYMKNEIKENNNIKANNINTKTINSGNKNAIKKGNNENETVDEKKDYKISKKENKIEYEENNNFDKMSIQSISDSKIYELTNNYMKNEDLIDKHQINNILYNKKNKNI